jgi:signal transduction histidine kinase/purine-cytosine permease-like protein
MLRVKREYQSWVANESLEDYALRYAASGYRRWAPRVMANTALGGISFLALEAIGASITLSYGFATAMAAIVVVSLIIFLVSLPIAYWCAVSNVDIDLLTRGAGFGYVGSTITSLIYGSFTLIFFAIETAIWAQALHLALGLQLALGYLLCSLVIIPLVFFGVTSISKLQAWSQPVWVVMLVLPFVYIVYKDPALLQAWVAYDGLEGRGAGFNLMMFGAASGVLFSLVAQIGEQADYLRFLPERTPQNRRAWWTALLLAGPGWIVIGALKVSAGGLLAVLALRMGSSAAQAVEPVHMFVHAYRQVVDDPALALGLAAIFVTISQIKINVTNAYSGSLAWSNCFVRLAHYHPGRVVWLVFSVLIALLLTLLGIFETLQTVLSVYSTVAIAWIGALVADLAVLKRTGISPPYIEFKRAHLVNFNPVGCGATAIGAIVAVLAYAGGLGSWGQAFFGFIAFGAAFVSAIAIAYGTGGRYYIARADVHYRPLPKTTLVQCSICERQYEAPDMAHCPFYRGAICSLCCGLELHCHDHCKKPVQQQVAAMAAGRFAPRVWRRVGRFLGLLSVAAVLLGAAFLLTHRFMDLHGLATHPDFLRVMLRLYAATLVVSALGTWWIVLSQERQEQSERELLESIHHLEQTRAHLVETEKLASLGGLVAGVAHEINTPAGILVSSASFLQDRTVAVQQQAAGGALAPADQARYLRDAQTSSQLLLANAQRIAQLVQNFKQLAVDRMAQAPQAFDLRTLVHDTVRALQPRLDEAGVRVQLQVPQGIGLRSHPVALAQVLTNLVMNSLEHAFEPGAADRTIHVQASLDAASQELQIDYRDNGRGIEPALQARVFEPFFTTYRQRGGTGLGLYIVNQTVSRQLGGAVTLRGQPGEGACFVIRFPTVVPAGPDMSRMLAAPFRGTQE